MTDTTKKPASPRLQHVVVHTKAATGGPDEFDDVHVFGTELEALRYMLGKPDLVYAAVPHGASVREALAGGEPA